MWKCTVTARGGTGCSATGSRSERDLLSLKVVEPPVRAAKMEQAKCNFEKGLKLIVFKEGSDSGVLQLFFFFKKILFMGLVN